ncbi:MAG: alpha/beta hydrolase, partial [Pseudomonadota bacterium]
MTTTLATAITGHAHPNRPSLLWLNGFRSAMAGTKATALAKRAEATGRHLVRFDYRGHGASPEAFE